MTTTYNQSTVTYDQSSLTYQGLPTQFDGVAFVVEMAFGYGPLDTDPSWQAVTPYVRDIRIDRGRRSEYVQNSPGQLLLMLDNRSRRFDPDYTSGPYYGDLVPMVPVRVQVTYDGTTYTLFRGFVQGWPTAYDTSNTDAVSTVTALDANRMLANLKLARSFYYQTISADAPSYYWDFQQPSVQNQSDDIQNLSLSFLTATSATPQTFTSNLPLELPTMESTNGHFRTATQISENIRTIEFWTDAGRIAESGATPGSILIYRSTTDQFLVDVDASKALFEIRFTNPAINRYIRIFPAASTVFTANQSNHIVVTLETSGALKTYVNGVLTSTNGTSTGTATYSSYSNIGVNITSSAMSNVAFYTSELSESQVAAHYEAGALAQTGELSSARLSRVLDDAGWPSAWREIETGVQTVGAYRPDSLAASRYFPQIDNAEQGALFVNRDGDIELRSRTTTATANIVALFDDEGIDAPFSDITVDGNTVDSIVNTVEATYAYGTVTSQDATSVAAYGESLSRLDVRLIDTAADATTIADVLVAKSKDPRTRVTRLDIPVRRDPATIVPMVAPLDLADDVTVSFTPTSVGDPLWRAVRVQGIRHNISLENWRVSLYLAPGPVNTNGPLVVLDDDTYGKLDSGNKLG